MKDKTQKLENVKRTLEVCKNMAKYHEEFKKEWLEQGELNNAFTCGMLKDAYNFVAQMLERDLSDKE